MSVTVIAEGLTDLESYLARAPGISTTAARIAINDTVSGPGMKLLRGAVEDEVNFPASYVNNDRLFVADRATNANLEARIVARVRPTSLARFSNPGQTPEGSRKAGGTTVTVHRGVPRKMRGAFLMRLRQGSTQVADGGPANIGLAIRLKKGETIHNKKAQSAIQLDHNLYLLYGPSIGQVFREIAEEQSPFILDHVAVEFLRQFTRLSD